MKRISYTVAKMAVLLGGDIMIHGLHASCAKIGNLHVLRDWTLGCVAVINEEIDEIFAQTAVGTRAEIRS